MNSYSPTYRSLRKETAIRSSSALTELHGETEEKDNKDGGRARKKKRMKRRMKRRKEES